MHVSILYALILYEFVAFGEYSDLVWFMIKEKLNLIDFRSYRWLYVEFLIKNSNFLNVESFKWVCNFYVIEICFNVNIKLACVSKASCFWKLSILFLISNIQFSLVMLCLIFTFLFYIFNNLVLSFHKILKIWNFKIFNNLNFLKLLKLKI